MTNFCHQLCDLPLAAGEQASDAVFLLSHLASAPDQPPSALVELVHIPTVVQQQQGVAAKNMDNIFYNF
jgi:hypothetical protein